MYGSPALARADRALRKGARSVPTRIILVAVLTLAGCTAEGAVAARTGTPASAAPAAPLAGCSTKVSANVASIEKMTAAFDGAGIPNAELWAEEVDEYRPYPDDPTWAKLNKELGKYNIDPAILDAILSCLTG
jgi:hypothetical protein